MFSSVANKDHLEFRHLLTKSYFVFTGWRVFTWNNYSAKTALQPFCFFHISHENVLFLKIILFSKLTSYKGLKLLFIKYMDLIWAIQKCL